MTSMSDHHSHHHSHQREDYGSRFKRTSLASIAFRRKADKWLKIILFFLSFIMITLVVLAYLYG